jgi:hypothetical protein
MNDNEDDVHDNNYDSDSESDDYDDDCYCNACVNRRGAVLDGDDDDDDNYYTPASSVPQLCAQLRTNDPIVLPEGPNELFQPDVPNS